MVNSMSEIYKILSCHMVSICSKQNLTRLWPQCVHINHQNMHDYIGNVCFIFLNNVQVLISQLHNNIIKIQILLLQ